MIYSRPSLWSFGAGGPLFSIASAGMMRKPEETRSTRPALPKTIIRKWL
nr:MAG TPA: hypothetical protein [Caudoviricetes sp.]